MKREAPRFFVDRSLGAHIVPDALKATGWRIETMDERYGVDESQKVRDVDWVREASLRGEAILCKDKAIAAVPLEAQTVYMHDARVFAIGDARITGMEIAERLIRNQDRIFRWVSMKTGPFVCSVGVKSLKRLRIAYP
jgi:hypothetical protein